MRVIMLRKRQLVLFAMVAMFFGGFYLRSNLPDYSGYVASRWKLVDMLEQNASEKYVPEKSLEFLELQQVGRRNLAKEVCKLSEKTLTLDSVLEDKDLLDHIIVDDEHQLMYCYVPKVACTNWKRLLMVLMGKANTTDPLAIVADDAHRQHVFRHLNNYTSEEIRYKLEHYMKFMFVRHPFERLLSAYRNKFSQRYSSSEYFHARYGRLIVKQYRNNATNDSLEHGHDVTFREFVQYIIDPRTVSRAAYNEHWRPMVDLCLPCTIQYNVIGKYENLMDDAYLVLEKAQLSQYINFPRSDRPSSTNSLIEEYASKLTAEELMHLYHIYELDFRLFDYNSSGFDGTKA